MKPLHAIAAALLLFATAASAADYMIIKPQVQLWSAPGDDMRAKIVGDVVAFSAASVDLEGGVTVPVRGAGVDIGQHATFACAVIDLPVIRDCELVSVQDAAKPARRDGGGSVKLW